MKIDQAVREMHPPRYTVSEAAKHVGRSADTVRRWAKQGAVEPSDSREFGKTVVPLYTQQDLRVLAEYARTVRPGRKAGTTPPEGSE